MNEEQLQHPSPSLEAAAGRVLYDLFYMSEEEARQLLEASDRAAGILAPLVRYRLAFGAHRGDAA